MDIPENVKFEIKAKQIRVKGPRGILTRNFKHLNLDFQMIEEGKKLKVDAWFGSRKTIAAIRTAVSHINNLITGVTKGYRYKMRFVIYMLTFPSMLVFPTRKTALRFGTFWARRRSEKVKDELVLEGNDIELVSRSCALINQKCHVKNKDIRKFLDGIYVSEKGSIADEEYQDRGRGLQPLS
ncbi:hypothetical protein R1sor_014237 [Riccia sorocarpa]|uniref:Large ribosomal subunit protein uL6 alpha-beta domain-containing protein n=1 Tax=Riccia sorocarpa TaxID=122646 RepID=A0ABD3H917_9MARC